MGKKPLIGWVGLCGLGMLLTGCNCCNTQGRREGQPFAGGRADASAGWTNKAMNRQPQNVVAGGTASGTESISGMSSGGSTTTTNQFNTAGNAGGGWGGSQGMGVPGGMPASNGGGMMSPMGPGTPTSYNGGSPQMNGGMNTALNPGSAIPANAMYVGSSRSSPIMPTGGSMNDTTSLTTAAGSQPVNPVGSGVRPALATGGDMSAVPPLPPPPPTGAGSSSSWSGSSTTYPPPAPPSPSDSALNTPPPVSAKSSSSMSGSSAMMPDYLKSKTP